MGKSYYTLAEAAERLALTAEELADLVRDNNLRVRQDGRSKLLRAKDVDALAGDGRERTDPAPDDVADAISLSEADQAILQGFGGGSGLLELTRERYDTSLGDVRYHIDLEAPAGSDLAVAAESMGKAWMTIQEAAAALGVTARTIEGRIKAGGLDSRLRPDGRREVLVTTRPTEAEAAPEGAPAGVLQADRQVEIARATLVMAKKLAEAHEADLKRARRTALLAWLAVVALAVAVGAALWWGTRQAGWHELERQKVSNLSDRLTDAETRLKKEEGRAAKLTTELETVRAELRALQQKKDQLQTDLAASRGQLFESKAAVQALTGDLKIATAKAALLSAELERARATTRPTTQPAEGRAGT